MQSALAILPLSSPMAKTGAGPVTDPEADPCDGFGRLLAGDKATGEGETAVVSPSAAEAVVPAAHPVPIWADPAATAAVSEAAEAEAVVLIGAAGRSGMRDARAAPVAPGDVSLTARAAVSPGQHPGHGGSAQGLAVPQDTDTRHLVGTGIVGAADGAMDQAPGTASSSEDAPGGLASRQGWSMPEPAPQAETPAVTTGVLPLRSGHDPVAAPGQAGAGPTAGNPVDSPSGLIDTEGEPSAPPPGAEAGLAPAGRNAPASPPARTDSGAALRGDVSAVRSEDTTAWQAMSIPERRSMGEGLMDEQVSASGDAVQGAARAGTGDRPQASFWERLLSGMIDAKGIDMAADGTAGQIVVSLAEGPEAPPAAPAGRALPIPPPGSPAGTRAGAVEAGMLTPTAGADVGPSSTAGEAGTDRSPSGVAPGIVTVKAGPHPLAELGPMPGADPRVAMPGPDAAPQVSDDPVPFALPGLPAFAAQMGAVPAANPVPMPQLAAQVAAALTRGVDGETELALSPEELGHVRVKLKPDSANPDRLVVMITFERPETLDLFRRHAGDLADALRAAGYSGADLGFDQQHSGQSGATPHDHAAARSLDGTTRPDPVGPPPPSPRHSGAASLDLRL